MTPLRQFEWLLPAWLTALFSLAGCLAFPVTFLPVGYDGAIQADPVRHVTLADQKGGKGTLSLSVRGQPAGSQAGQRLPDRFEVSVVFVNGFAQPVTLPLDNFRLLNDRGDSIQPMAQAQSARVVFLNPPSRQIVIPPGGAGEAELLFPCPKKKRTPARTQSVSVTGSFEIAGQPGPISASFVREPTPEADSPDGSDAGGGFDTSSPVSRTGHEGNHAHDGDHGHGGSGGHGGGGGGGGGHASGGGGGGGSHSGR